MKRRLPDKDVLDIYFSNELQKVIAHRYGIMPSQVSHIKRGFNYKDVTALYRDASTLNATLATLAFAPEVP